MEPTKKEAIQTALYHLTQASSFLYFAEFNDTAFSLASFASKALETLSEKEGDLKKVELPSDEYDKILNDILAIEI